jgi:hypothetical protein
MGVYFLVVLARQLWYMFNCSYVYYTTCFCRPNMKECCQLLVEFFGQIKKKVCPLMKKFGPLVYYTLEDNISCFSMILNAKLHRVIYNIGENLIFWQKILLFCEKPIYSKVRPLFSVIFFLLNLPKIRPQIFLARKICFGPFCVLRQKFRPQGKPLICKCVMSAFVDHAVCLKGHSHNPFLRLSQ